MRVRTRSELAGLGRLVLVSTAAAAVFGLIAGGDARAPAVSGLIGLAISVLLGAFEILFFARRAGAGYRRRTFLLVFLSKTLIYTVVIVGAIILVPAMFGDLRLAPMDPGELGASVRVGPLFLPALAFCFVAAGVINFVSLVRRLVGHHVLAAVFLGRYHYPREEDRILLFLDLVGSTGIAERLGNLGFHRLLNDILYDMTEPVMENGGTIYKYVGDEVIITWRAGSPRSAFFALSCYLSIVERLDSRAGHYKSAYAMVPRFHAGMHLGPVVVGEMGDLRQEVALLGDTVNTAARIEQMCRELNEPIIISEALRGREALPTGIETESLGTVLLRGKEQSIHLHALRRTSS